MIIHDFSPPLSDELLNKYSFFNLYPFDGGGRFVQEKIIGTLNDRMISERIIKGNALHEFGNLPELDFRRFEKWRSIEKSCWINRFYFIVPLAAECRRSGSVEFCRLLTDTMLFFVRNFPPPRDRDEILKHSEKVTCNMTANYNGKSYEEYSRDETDVEYIWFDFQPASRMLHFIYAMYFLRGFECISESEWSELENSIRAHADVIAVQESVAVLTPDNHQSLRGLALLFAAAFFRKEKFSEIYLKEGLRICNYHMENDFFDDGVLKEISPSYHSFETWHIRDACLLAEKYNFAISPESEIPGKAVSYIKYLTQPDGLLPVINDGYALSADGFIESLECFTGENVNDKMPGRYFVDAGIALYKYKNKYLLMDFSVFTGTFSHYHCGKNSFSYWFNDKAFFIDSGCCDYDDPLFAEWYKTAAAHSSLLIDNGGDGELKGTYEWLRHAELECSGWMEEEGLYSISSKLKSNVPSWKNISWERTFEVGTEDKLVISDKIFSPMEKELCLVFNLHPDVKVRNRDFLNIELSNNDEKLLLSFKSMQEIKLEQSAGKVFVEFSHVDNSRILVRSNSGSGNCTFIRTEIKRI